MKEEILLFIQEYAFQLKHLNIKFGLMSKKINIFKPLDVFLIYKKI